MEPIKLRCSLSVFMLAGTGCLRTPTFARQGLGVGAEATGTLCPLVMAVSAGLAKACRALASGGACLESLKRGHWFTPQPSHCHHLSSPDAHSTDACSSTKNVHLEGILHPGDRRGGGLCQQWCCCSASPSPGCMGESLSLPRTQAARRRLEIRA